MTTSEATTFQPLKRRPGGSHSTLLGERFTWGPVLNEYEYPELGIAIIESEADYSRHGLNQQEQYAHEHGKPRFHLLTRKLCRDDEREGRQWSGNHSFGTIEEAMLFGIAYNVNGNINTATHLAPAMYRMIEPRDRD